MLTVSTSSFDNTFLPTSRTWQEAISGIDWLTAFVSFHPQLNTLDASGSIEAASSRINGGYGFTQATISEQPTPAADGVNSMPSGFFDASSGYNQMLWDGTFATGDFTKVAIFQVPDLTQGQMDILSDNDGAEKHQLFITTGDQLRATVGDTNEARVTISGTLSENTPYVAICGYTASTGELTLQLNGGTALSDTVALSTFDNDRVILGSANDSGSGPFHGYIGAVMIGSENVFASGNEEDLALILAYAEQAWGVTIG